MGFTAWNPWAWSLFALGILVLVMSVKLFHKKYPEYPFGPLSRETVHVMENHSGAESPIAGERSAAAIESN